MDEDNTRLTLVEKIGSRKGRVVNLAQLRRGVYDIAIYQPNGDIKGSYIRDLSLHDIELLLENIEEGEFCICPAGKRQLGDIL